jgi:predicted dehydrogenase
VSRRGVPVYDTFDEAIDRHEVDFVCVCVPAESLPEVAARALDARMPVLVEKPLAADEQRALALVQQAERLGVVLRVGHVERCNPAVIELKRRLDDGAIGRIYQLHARRLSPFPDRDSMLGVSLDLATHDIDVMRYLTGADIQRVFAETAQRRHDTAEDLLVATMRFDDDSTGLLEVNWLTPTKVRQLTVTGEGGMFVVDYLTQDLCFYAHPSKPIAWDVLKNMRGTGEGDMVRYALSRREPLLVEWEEFLAAVDDSPSMLATGRDGYAALSTARAIQSSGRTHSTVIPNYRTSAPA